MRLSLGALVILGLSFSLSSKGFTAPTDNEVYHNDDLRVIVYEDSIDKDIFWYLPSFKLQDRPDGKGVQYSVVKKENKFIYHFKIIPYMPNDVLRFLAKEIPGIKSTDQLKPLIANRIAVSADSVNSIKFSEPLTSVSYINQPIKVTFEVDEKLNDEFIEEASDYPGVLGNIYLFHRKDSVDKFLKVDLKYKQVIEALSLKFGSLSVFAKADVEIALNYLLTQTYIDIVKTGDISIPEVIEKLISECFESKENQKTGEVNLRLKKQKIDIQKTVFWQEIHYKEVDSLRVIPFGFTFSNKIYINNVTVVPSTKYDMLVTDDATILKPYEAIIPIEDYEQISLDFGFYILASSSYTKYKMKEYAWDGKWGNPLSALYYRINSDDKWKKVDKNFIIPADKINKSRFEFYVDKKALWDMLPKNFTKGKMLGIVPPIFRYDLFGPMFQVKVKSSKLSLN